MKTYILYNPISHHGRGLELAKESCRMFLNDEHEFLNLIELTDRKAFFEGIEKEAMVVVAGGDGTLSYFATSVATLVISQDLYYVPTGIGNDFATELSKKGIHSPIKLKKYLKGLPLVEVKGKTYRFINGVGFGLDGYCARVGSLLHKKNTPANYKKIASQGILRSYKPCPAEITVDGVTESYENVWFATTMNGSMYDGGMIPTPDQDRLNTEGTVSLCIFYGKNRLKALFAFPSIFRGKLGRHQDMVRIVTGKDILVQFSEARNLQIDGEPFKNVIEYHVTSGR